MHPATLLILFLVSLMPLELAAREISDPRCPLNIVTPEQWEFKFRVARDCKCYLTLKAQPGDIRIETHWSFLLAASSKNFEYIDSKMVHLTDEQYLSEATPISNGNWYGFKGRESFQVW